VTDAACINATLRAGEAAETQAKGTAS